MCLCAGIYTVCLVKKNSFLSLKIFWLKWVVNLIYRDIIFSSSELKAQVSFSNCLSSIIHPSVRPSVCRLFIFSLSSPEPNLTQLKHCLEKGTQGFTTNEHSVLKKEVMVFFIFSQSMLWHSHSFAQMC